jgi:hypothetical protein
MIYFIRDEATQVIKIGYTAGDGESRLRDLQTGCPGELVVLLEIEGSKQDETAWHQRFAAARERGEWFRPVAELLLAISEGKVVQLEEEKAQLQERLEAVQSRFSVVRGQLGSLWASMGGTPVPLMKGLDPRTGTPLEQQNELLQAKVDAEQRSRKSLRTALRNIVDWIDKPASSSERPVIYGHAEESED